MFAIIFDDDDDDVVVDDDNVVDDDDDDRGEEFKGALLALLKAVLSTTGADGWVWKKQSREQLEVLRTKFLE